MRSTPLMPKPLWTKPCGSSLANTARIARTSIRTVDIVGLSGGGAACGAALFGLIYRYREPQVRMRKVTPHYCSGTSIGAADNFPG